MAAIGSVTVEAADDGLHHLVVRADDGAPADQLRAALERLAEALRSLGIRPSGMRSMEWSASRPACFHLRRTEIDLVYREVFGGVRPPISLRASREPLRIHAVALRRDPPADRPVWRGLGLRELERQMSPRSGVGSMEAVFRQKRERAAAFRRHQPHAAFDIAYGDDRSEAFDLFYPSDAPDAPLWVFIHGGYWQASDKSDVHDLGRRMLEAGYAVAMPNYALCPPATLAHVVGQMRRCLAFIHEQARGLGIDAERIHVAGTSAGGHLAAMMACDPDLRFLRSALIVSGIHDLRPVALLPAGDLLGLDGRSVAALSPALLRPNADVRIGIAVGALESDEFRRMSADLAAAWSGRLLDVAGKAHFDVTDALASGGALADFALALAGG